MERKLRRKSSQAQATPTDQPERHLTFVCVQVQAIAIELLSLRAWETTKSFVICGDALWGIRKEEPKIDPLRTERKMGAQKAIGACGSLHLRKNLATLTLYVL